ncbi:hypothetical protein IM792_07465 [Mucilaginibacter sp. JRF]|uniref:DUF6660 family protein n=1 Tax=Mucilaginibacter sp. JRF TaxID=2780088 RepID=UPI0018800401|nr:DUF6660 family protein [Mucilaginibacter sp. JRF]MBE9584280.1 hypothetical protein [Mucilaginibacter sp. JRF]
MKLFCLIISFFVLMLSVRPCCAEDACKDEIGNKHEQSSGKQSHDEDCRGCSPFFSCGSCMGFIMRKSVIQTVTLFPLHQKQSVTPYHQPEIKEVDIDIWQPPQLS